MEGTLRRSSVKDVEGGEWRGRRERKRKREGEGGRFQDSVMEVEESRAERKKRRKEEKVAKEERRRLRREKKMGKARIKERRGH